MLLVPLLVHLALLLAVVAEGQRGLPAPLVQGAPLLVAQVRIALSLGSVLPLPLLLAVRLVLCPPLRPLGFPFVVLVPLPVTVAMVWAVAAVLEDVAGL